MPIRISYDRKRNNIIMAEQQTTTLYLTPEDALLFVQYQKRHCLIDILEKLKVFDIRNGSVEIHFGDIGEVRKVDLHQHHKVV